MDDLLAAVSAHIAHDTARNSTLNVKQSQRLRAVDANNAFEGARYFLLPSTLDAMRDAALEANDDRCVMNLFLMTASSAVAGARRATLPAPARPPP
jgi:hypothetical protein